MEIVVDTIYNLNPGHLLCH